MIILSCSSSLNIHQRWETEVANSWNIHQIGETGVANPCNNHQRNMDILRVTVEILEFIFNDLFFGEARVGESLKYSFNLWVRRCQTLKHSLILEGKLGRHSGNTDIRFQINSDTVEIFTSMSKQYVSLEFGGEKFERHCGNIYIHVRKVQRHGDETPKSTGQNRLYRLVSPGLFAHRTG